MNNERIKDVADFMSRLSAEDMSAKIVRNVICWGSKGMDSESIQKNLSDTFTHMSVYRRPDFRTACVDAFAKLDGTIPAQKAGKDAILELGRKIEAKFPNIIREAQAPSATLS